jgi:hypothetical protein
MSSGNVLVLIVLLGALTALSAAADVPLSRVVMFTSGVGYFEREGSVQGNTSVELSFRTNQINDILKSMVLQDLGGGAIAPVTYAPQDPLERTLSSFAVDISDNPSVVKVWDRLRGTRVKLDAESTVEGVVFGSEEQEKSVGDNILKFQVLNVLTDAGLVAVPLWQVRTLTLLDPAIDSDLRKALQAIDQARDTDKRPVTITFRGDGNRNVAIGYLLETPVWKTSYRLVSDKEGLFLQGWAIVENTSDDDWENVTLSLVSGRPVSFIQDLYRPLYVKRPVVAPSVAAAAAPRIWEGDMEADEMAPAEDTVEGLAKAAPAPSVAMGAGMAAPAAPRRERRAMDLATTGAQSIAEGGKVGTLFQYAINQPVSVPRQRSAMIPIINGRVEGEKVSVYNAQVDPKYPMNGIKLKNTTGLHLMGGPITVFDSDVYGGDALIEDIVPGDDRLLTYAVDLAVEVDPRDKYTPDTFISAKIVNGVMTMQYKRQSTLTYVAKNNGEEPRRLLVEHPVRDDWKLVTPETPEERTRSAYRFAIALEPGKTAELPVVEESVRAEIVALANQDSDNIGLIIERTTLSEQMKAALQRIVELRAELAQVAAKRQEAETQVEEITQEQDRIRQNMRELDRQSELYRKYVDKLTEQETQLEKLSEELRALRAEEQDKEKALADYVAGLNIEG